VSETRHTKRKSTKKGSGITLLETDIYNQRLVKQYRDTGVATTTTAAISTKQKGVRKGKTII
jgi:hypothetical protein